MRHAGHLRLQDCNQPVVLRELGLEVVTEALLDHAHPNFPFALTHECVYALVEVADFC